MIINHSRKRHTPTRPRDGRSDLHAPSLYPRDDASETHRDDDDDDDDDEVGCERSVSRIETQQQQGVNVIGIDATHQ